MHICCPVKLSGMAVHAVRTTPNFAYVIVILLLALYFDLYSLTNGSESNSEENSDRSASVDCSKKLLCSNRTQSCREYY